MIRLTRHPRAIAMLLAGWCAGGAAAQAQIPPQLNPAVINRQNQQTIQQLEQLRDIPAMTGPLVSAPNQPAVQNVAPGGPSFVLKQVIFPTSALLSAEELQALAAPLIGQKVDLSGLYGLVAQVNARYEAKGFPNASAVLPPQHVDAGVVRIELVEGRLGKVSVEGNNYIPPAFVLDRMALPAGEVLNVPAMSQSIAVFNRVNDIQTRAALQPGAQFGQTDVVFNVVEPPRDTLDFSVDNWGLNSTNNNEASFLYRRTSLLVADDRFTMYGIGNDGNLDGNVGYNLPVGNYGGRLGVNYGLMQTRVLHGPYQSLEIDGHAQVGSVDFSHPLFANENWLVSGLLNFSVISSANTQAGVTQTSDLTKKGGPGLLVSYLGPLTSAQITGTYAYGGTEYNTLGNSSSFNMVSGTFNLTQLLPVGLSFVVNGAWQETSVQRLSPDQLFQIGGPTSVRGYEADYVAGFSGFFSQFELHKDAASITPGLDLFSFLDMGRVYAPATPEKKLMGFGFGGNYAFDRWANLQVAAGWPLQQVAPGQSPMMVYFRLVLHAM